MFLNVVLLIVFATLGLGVFAFAGLQVILTLTCAIPATKNFISSGGEVDGRIYRAFGLTIAVNSAVTLAAVVLVLIFGSVYMIAGFFLGFAAAFLLSIRQWGISGDNLADYLKSYEKYIIKWPERKPEKNN